VFVDRSPQKKHGPKPERPFSDLWRNVDKGVTGIVDGANLASIIRKWTEQQKTYVHDWEI